MLQDLEKIGKLLAEDNIGEAAKSMAQFETYDRILNLNYYRAILAVKRKDFRSANTALDLEIEWFPGNDHARVLKTLISEPFCRNGLIEKKALDESEGMRKDTTGFRKPSATAVAHSPRHEDSISVNREQMRLKYLNLGCGNRFHSAWTNVDSNALSRNVINYDLNQGIPFDRETFDAVYHSHLLEHFSRTYGLKFLKECFRVLKPGGVLRVAVPDLEAIAGIYLDLLNEAAKGDKVARERYDWIVLEMFDQMVRNTSGGEMENYLLKNPMPAQDFVKARCGLGAIHGRRPSKLFGGHGNRAAAGKSRGKVQQGPLEIGLFRLCGEVHQWMYDRYSLGKLLEEVGFERIEVVKADESKIPKFNSYYLDIDVDGSVRKPDSLFMEAVKPVGFSIIKEEKMRSVSWPKVRNKSLEGLRVVHLCMQDFGGAGKAAYRLHKGLLRLGMKSTMLVLNKRSGDQSVKVLPAEYIERNVGCLDIKSYDSCVWQKQTNRWSESLLAGYPNRPRGLDVFTDAVSDVRLERVREIRDADIINLHWVAGVVDWPTAGMAFGNKPIVWTLHDMNAFTGGCHYAGDCERYKEKCGACPQLGSNVDEDISRQEWTKKFKGYEGLNISIVSPSRWLGMCASDSKILGGFSVAVIPNGFPLDIFRPYPKETCRNALKIPKSARVILFGADSILNERKGFIYLLKALNQLPERNVDDVVLLTFGSLPKGIKIPGRYSVINLGEIKDEKDLAKAYSVADVFALPSVEDNLPNTVIEAMACGVPVVGFDIGGMPDMIDHERTGYLAKPKDINGLTEGINYIFSSLDEGKDFAQICRKKLELQYGLETQANSYMELYERVIGGVRTPVNGIRHNGSQGVEWLQELDRTDSKPVEEGDHVERIEVLERIVDADPKAALAYHDLGALWLEQGDYDKSLKNYERAARIAPNSALFQKSLADFYYAIMKDGDAALEHYARALSLNPTDTGTLLMLGHISVAKEKLGEAKVFYKKVLEIDPGNEDANEKLRLLGRANDSVVEDDHKIAN